MNECSHQSIDQVFANAKRDKKPAFVTYTSCGFKEKADTVEILLGLQRGGANIIEARGIVYWIRGGSADEYDNV